MRQACCHLHEVGLKVASPPTLATNAFSVGSSPNEIRFCVQKKTDALHISTLGSTYMN